MELVLSGLGGLVILGLVAIAVVVVYVLLHRIIPGKAPKPTGYVGIDKCPLCGGRMEAVHGVPQIIHCSTPKCPNYVTDI